MVEFYKTKPTILTTVRVSPEFHKLCKQNNIRFSEAMRVGISILLAERGVREYDNDLNLFRKMKMFQKTAEDFGQKYHEIMGKMAEKEGFKLKVGERQKEPEENKKVEKELKEQIEDKIQERN